LGPEADADEDVHKKQVVNMNQAGPGAPALTAGAVPAQSMLGTGGTSSKTGPTMANQGAGLGDLLTHGEGTGLTGTGLGGNTHVSLTTLEVLWPT
jgi:hypothetical protein